MRKLGHTNDDGAAAAEESVPPLQMGDNLTREEFLRRWEEHPEVKKAELIGGIVYMPSPLRRGRAIARPAANAPPFENGDNLTLEEFLLRWEQHPEIKFAE